MERCKADPTKNISCAKIILVLLGLFYANEVRRLAIKVSTIELLFFSNQLLHLLDTINDVSTS